MGAGREESWFFGTGTVFSLLSVHSPAQPNPPAIESVPTCSPCTLTHSSGNCVYFLWVNRSREIIQDNFSHQRDQGQASSEEEGRIQGPFKGAKAKTTTYKYKENASINKQSSCLQNDLFDSVH